LPRRPEAFPSARRRCVRRAGWPADPYDLGVRNLFGRRGGGGGSGPDFSHVDSQEKAEQLARRGELARLHLVPPEFGGTDDPRNIVYVPPFVVELKQQTDANVIAPLVREGRVRSYAATPQYEGTSFVPVSIEIRASDPGEFETSLRIWGPALAES
jgi:hypothetical protein